MEEWIESVFHHAMKLPGASGETPPSELFNKTSLNDLGYFLYGAGAEETHQTTDLTPAIDMFKAVFNATPAMENAHLSMRDQAILYDVAFKPRFHRNYHHGAFAWRAVFGQAVRG